MNHHPERIHFSLNHRPYGEQHPYLPLASERFPRDPREGEPVHLGVETTPVGAAQQVWCSWMLHGVSKSARVAAEKVQSSQDADEWHISLPAFDGGQQVQYQICAQAEEQTIQSETFMFTVGRWISLRALRSLRQEGQQAVATFDTSDDKVLIQLTLSIIEENQLQLNFARLPSTSADDLEQDDRSESTWQSGDILVAFTAAPFSLQIQRKSDGLQLRTSQPIQLLMDGEGQLRQVQLAFDSPQEEGFSGLGERFNAFNHRGTTLDNRVYGQYTGQGKRSYIPVPFFLSSRGYGCWLQTERQAYFDFADSQENQWMVTAECEEEDARVDVRFFFQSDPKQIVRAFSRMTGKSVLPPPWVFGLWMSSNDWNSQAEVLRQLALAEEHRIPATVLVIEAWSDEINFYIWNDAQYELKPSSHAFQLSDFTFPADGRWPDPKGMIDTLHEAGLRLVLWQNPLIKQGEEREQLDERQNQLDQAYVTQQGYTVQKADGTPHRVEAHMPWFRHSLVIDFTNPQAVDWWFSKRAYLVNELGVDGFKTDGGEHIWDVDTRFANGLKGTRGINRYPCDYEMAYRHFMENHRGQDYVLFSRAGYTGAQAHPCHWAGDEHSTWEAFRATLHAMLNAGLSGISFMGWDIAGFAGPLPDSELYLRATAFSAFCPIMQYHSDVNYQRKPSRDRTPWNMQEQSGDERVLPIFRQFANLRMNLLPYLLAQASLSVDEGLPIMRALPLEYPLDETCRLYPSQYLLGQALLIAPVTYAGCQQQKVYLPLGAWRDFWTGELLQGPALLDVDVPLDRIPVYQRQSSLLTLHLDESGALCSAVGNRWDAFDQLTLRIFPGEAFESMLWQTEAQSAARVTISAVAENESLCIQLPPSNALLNLEIVCKCPRRVLLDGVLLNPTDGIIAWHWQAQTSLLKLTLPPSTGNREIRVE